MNMIRISVMEYRNIVTAERRGIGNSRTRAITDSSSYVLFMQNSDSVNQNRMLCSKEATIAPQIGATTGIQPYAQSGFFLPLFGASS